MSYHNFSRTLLFVAIIAMSSGCTANSDLLIEKYGAILVIGSWLLIISFNILFYTRLRQAKRHLLPQVTGLEKKYSKDREKFDEEKRRLYRAVGISDGWKPLLLLYSIVVVITIGYFLLSSATPLIENPLNEISVSLLEIVSNPRWLFAILFFCVIVFTITLQVSDNSDSKTNQFWAYLLFAESIISGLIIYFFNQIAEWSALFFGTIFVLPLSGRGFALLVIGILTGYIIGKLFGKGIGINIGLRATIPICVFNLGLAFLLLIGVSLASLQAWYFLAAGHFIWLADLRPPIGHDSAGTLYDAITLAAWVFTRLSGDIYVGVVEGNERREEIKYRVETDRKIDVDWESAARTAAKVGLVYFIGSRIAKNREKTSEGIETRASVTSGTLIGSALGPGGAIVGGLVGAVAARVLAKNENERKS